MLHHKTVHAEFAIVTGSRPLALRAPGTAFQGKKPAHAYTHGRRGGNGIIFSKDFEHFLIYQYRKTDKSDRILPKCQERGLDGERRLR